MRWRAVDDDALRHNEALAVAAAGATRLDEAVRAPVSSTSVPSPRNRCHEPNRLLPRAAQRRSGNAVRTAP
jgi:hypothetical protein